MIFIRSTNIVNDKKPSMNIGRVNHFPFRVVTDVGNDIWGGKRSIVWELKSATKIWKNGACYTSEIPELVRHCKYCNNLSVGSTMIVSVLVNVTSTELWLLGCSVTLLVTLMFSDDLYRSLRNCCHSGNGTSVFAVEVYQMTGTHQLSSI